MDIEPILAGTHALWERARVIWTDGGWGMAAIAANALVLFALGWHLQLVLLRKNVGSMPEATWRRWIRRPQERRGTLGRLVGAVAGARTVDEAAAVFEDLRKAEIAPFRRDLRVMRICVGVAPLLGLFGTVTGMLATFDALASGSGGEKTMGLIAKGISEALITTETGLVIALPGLFFQYLLARQLGRYDAFLAHVETVCTQHVHREERARRTAESARELVPVPRAVRAASVERAEASMNRAHG